MQTRQWTEWGLSCVDRSLCLMMNSGSSRQSARCKMYSNKQQQMKLCWLWIYVASSVNQSSCAQALIRLVDNDRLHDGQWWPSADDELSAISSERQPQQQHRHINPLFSLPILQSCYISIGNWTVANWKDVNRLSDCSSVFSYYFGIVLWFCRN